MGPTFISRFCVCKEQKLTETQVESNNTETQFRCNVQNTRQHRTRLKQEHFYFNPFAILFWILTTMQSSAKVSSGCVLE